MQITNDDDNEYKVYKKINTYVFGFKALITPKIQKKKKKLMTLSGFSSTYICI